MRERLTLAFVGLALVIIVVAGAVRDHDLEVALAITASDVVRVLDDAHDDARRQIRGELLAVVGAERRYEFGDEHEVEDVRETPTRKGLATDSRASVHDT